MSDMNELLRCPVWAITSYFNPNKWSRRRLNYLRFRQELPLPLVTVELSFDGSFDLGPQHADVLLQLPATTLVWHKETLLNLALGSVPKVVPYIAWIDCDVIFPRARSDWLEAIISQLAAHDLVQLFSELIDRGPAESLLPQLPAPDQTAATGSGIASLLSRVGPSAICFVPQTSQDMRSTAFGIAWASHARLLRKHQFYDAMIVGSGDRALVCAALGKFESPISTLCLSESRANHYLAWARPFFHDVQANIGFVSGPAMHLWHGTVANRKSKERHEQLAKLGFDPVTDLERTPSGLWRWRRPRPDLERFFSDYFRNRKEDAIPE